MNSPQKKSKKLWLLALAALVALPIMGGIWKSNSNAKHRITLNRNLADKYCALGQPLGSDFTEKVDLEMLKNDPAATSILKLYRHREAIKEEIVLGKPTPSVFSQGVDLELLKADSEAGSEQAGKYLELINQRQKFLAGVQLGKEPPANLLSTLNLELLRDDAEAGNNRVERAFQIHDNRKLSEKLCVFGKPFDFYQKVDHALLEEDVYAGYLPGKDILTLANHRMTVAELTVTGVPYKKDFFTAVDRKLLQKDANAGNADAQYAWARIHYQTNVVKQDLAVAIKYYTLASNQNHAPSLTNLAYCYSRGVGVTQNKSKYFTLTKKAAELSYPLAIYNLSVAYRDGNPVAKNIEKSMELLNKSAKLNCANAQYDLGTHYNLGRYGMKKDLKKAEVYYRKAADQLYRNAIYSLVTLIEKTRPVQQARKEVLAIFHKAALQGEHYSEAWYGRMLVRGHGAKKDLKEGIKWIKKSAAVQDPIGMQALADMYRQGKGVEKNFPKAVELHKLVAEKNYSHSMYNLGVIYAQGKPGVPKDMVKAVKYHQMAFNYQNNISALSLARIYIAGDGIPKDVDKALTILETAVKRGHSDSCNELGLIYMNAKIVDQDPEKGIAYYRLGVERGNAFSIANLGVQYLTGKFIPKDEAEALRLFRLSVSKNNHFGMYRLGQVYELGLCGVNKDVKEAIKYYTRSAKKPYPKALEALERLKKAP